MASAGMRSFGVFILFLTIILMLSAAFQSGSCTPEKRIGPLPMAANPFPEGFNPNRETGIQFNALNDIDYLNEKSSN
jgi:hypothetical protein